MALSFGACVLVATYYWICNIDLGSMGRVLMNPTFIGVLFGFFFGDVAQGCIVGASINVMYISVAAVGANMPADDSLAACVAVPVALATGMDAQTAVLLAVPFGILGTFMDNLRRMVNGVWNQRLLKCCENLDFRGITLCNTLGPWAVQAAIRIPIVTAIMVGVSSSTTALMDMLPAWVMTALSTVGGILPGFGLVLCATFIGRKYLFPFFIVGFFAMKIFNFPMLVATIFGFFMAWLFVRFTYPEEEGASSGFDFSIFSSKNATYDGALSKSECSREGLRIVLLHRFGNSLEAMYGTGVCHSMMPVLRKIYAGKDEQLAEALERHALPYISEMCLGNCILGAATAMEEQIAAGSEEITGDDIVTLKSSLMGPFAGFGDSLLYSTIAPLIRTIFLPFAIEGSVIAGLLMEFVIRLGATIAGVWSFDLGYRLGRGSIMALLKGGIMKKLMVGAGVLGMFMLGCMASSYCKLTLALTFANATLGTEYVLQNMLDSILPGLLPFLMLIFTYRYFDKGGKYPKLIIIVLVACLVLAFFGVV